MRRSDPPASTEARASSGSDTGSTTLHGLQPGRPPPVFPVLDASAKARGGRVGQDVARLLLQDARNEERATGAQRGPERGQQRPDHAAQDVGEDDVETAVGSKPGAVYQRLFEAYLRCGAMAFDIVARVDQRIGIALDRVDVACAEQRC